MKKEGKKKEKKKEKKEKNFVCEEMIVPMAPAVFGSSWQGGMPMWAGGGCPSGSAPGQKNWSDEAAAAAAAAW